MIQLERLGKKYIREWIFRELSYTFEPGKAYAVTGGNGSGKSTLLQCIAGMESHSRGSIRYQVGNTLLEREMLYRHISYTAPYVELLEEYTLLEALRFHFKFRSPLLNLKEPDLLKLSGLEQHQNKLLQHFSSGMKQRLKLLLAICTESSWLLLDEPCTNLDEKASQWYLQLVQEFQQGRTILVASNQPTEYSFCKETVHIENYKA